MFAGAYSITALIYLLVNSPISFENKKATTQSFKFTEKERDLKYLS